MLLYTKRHIFRVTEILTQWFIVFKVNVGPLILPRLLCKSYFYSAINVFSTTIWLFRQMNIISLMVNYIKKIILEFMSFICSYNVYKNYGSLSILTDCTKVLQYRAANIKHLHSPDSPTKKCE